MPYILQTFSNLQAGPHTLPAGSPTYVEMPSEIQLAGKTGAVTQPHSE